MTTAPIPEFISVEELSQLLDVPVSTIRGWRQAGTGPAAYRIGGRLRYTLADVTAWLETQRTGGGAR